MFKSAPSIATPRELEITTPQLCAHPVHRWTWVATFGISAAIAHSCGYLFGIGNQVTYFIEPLRRAHPELYRNDWFAAQTAYHSLFAAAASYLFRVEDSGVIGCAITHAILMVALVTAVFVVVKGVANRGVLAVFVIVVAWLTISGDRSVAGSYLWSGYLQPSLIATAGWIFALAAHVRGRPLMTGVALAVGGLFHANFLVLGLGLFTLAELLARRSGVAKRLALLLVPQLVAFAILAPALLASAGGGDFALWILVHFHTPLHYDPLIIGQQLPLLGQWIVLAFVVAPIARSYGCRVPVDRLVTWCLLAGAICVLAVPVLMVPQLAGLTRLYVWRLAPFAQLAAMIVIALAAVATIENPACWRAVRAWRPWLAGVLAAVVVWRVPLGPNAVGGWAPIAVVVAIIIAIVAPRLRSALPIIAALAGLAIVLHGRWDTIAHPEVTVASAGFDTDDLYDWARTSTPVDTVFLTPPSLGRFRLHARRAIIVDFKSPPLVPDELVVWYRRLGAVTGEPHLTDVPQAERLWSESTRPQLLARARALGAQYLVLERRHEDGELRGSVYGNELYIVYPTTNAN